jgi:hypothetical protein
VRGKIAEAAVKRKALIKAIANFVKDILANTTLVDTPLKRESVELGTQTITDRTTPQPPYETPISGTRFEGLPIATSDDVKKMYIHLLESLSVMLLVPTCHRL